MFMKPRPNHKIYINVLRKMSPEDRLHKAFELSEFTRRLFIHGLHKKFPDAKCGIEDCPWNQYHERRRSKAAWQCRLFLEMTPIICRTFMLESASQAFHSTAVVQVIPKTTREREYSLPCFFEGGHERKRVPTGKGSQPPEHADGRILLLMSQKTLGGLLGVFG